jgi:hypothetical protein
MAVKIAQLKASNSAKKSLSYLPFDFSLSRIENGLGEGESRGRGPRLANKVLL